MLKTLIIASLLILPLFANCQPSDSIPKYDLAPTFIGDYYCFDSVQIRYIVKVIDVSRQQDSTLNSYRERVNKADALLSKKSQVIHNQSVIISADSVIISEQDTTISDQKIIIENNETILKNEKKKKWYTGGIGLIIAIIAIIL